MLRNNVQRKRYYFFISHLKAVSNAASSSPARFITYLASTKSSLQIGKLIYCTDCVGWLLVSSEYL